MLKYTQMDAEKLVKSKKKKKKKVDTGAQTRSGPLYCKQHKHLKKYFR